MQIYEKMEDFLLCITGFMLARKFSGIISQKRVSPCVKNWQRLSKSRLGPKGCICFRTFGDMSNF